MKNMRIIRFAAIGLLVSGLSGCVKTTTTQIDAETAEALSAIEVLYSPPTRPYDEIGLVTTQTGQTIFHDRSANGMILKLQEEALKLGADAVIVRNVNEGTWGLKGGGNTGFDRGNAQGVAIKYKAESAEKEPAAE